MGLRKRLVDRFAGFRFMMGMRFDRWFRAVYSEDLFRYLVYRSMGSLTIGFWVMIFSLDVSNVIAWSLLAFGVLLLWVSIEVLDRANRLEEEEAHLLFVLEESGLIKYKDGVEQLNKSYKKL